MFEQVRVGVALLIFGNVNAAVGLLALDATLWTFDL